MALIPKDQEHKTNRKDQSGEQGYNIKVVARRTGLSPHVIRVWERRYQAVSPSRSATARRLYTDAEIERLLLLRQATLAGHSIGQIANLPTPRLAELVEADRVSRANTALNFPRPVVEPASADNKSQATAAEFIQQCTSAVESLDADALTATLTQAAVVLGQSVMMEQVVAPLMIKIGDCWRQGTLRVSHEHLASAIIRTALGEILRGPNPGTPAPVIVVTTPSGQLHEIGALMVAATAASEGWRVTYLGPNLPMEEIAAVTLRTGARAVALSLVYPADDFRMQDELRKLRSYLSDDVVLLVGGRAAEAYSPVLDAIQAIKLNDMLSLRTCLETLRTNPPANSDATADPSNLTTTISTNGRKSAKGSAKRLKKAS